MFLAAEGGKRMKIPETAAGVKRQIEWNEQKIREHQNSIAYHRDEIRKLRKAIT